MSTVPKIFLSTFLLTYPALAYSMGQEGSVASYARAGGGSLTTSSDASYALVSGQLTDSDDSSGRPIFHDSSASQLPPENSQNFLGRPPTQERLAALDGRYRDAFLHSRLYLDLQRENGFLNMGPCLDQWKRMLEAFKQAKSRDFLAPLSKANALTECEASTTLPCLIARMAQWGLASCGFNAALSRVSPYVADAVPLVRTLDTPTASLALMVGSATAALVTQAYKHYRTPPKTLRLTPVLHARAVCVQEKLQRAIEIHHQGFTKALGINPGLKETIERTEPEYNTLKETCEKLQESIRSLQPERQQQLKPISDHVARIIRALEAVRDIVMDSYHLAATPGQEIKIGIEKDATLSLIDVTSVGAIAAHLAHKQHADPSLIIDHITPFAGGALCMRLGAYLSRLYLKARQEGLFAELVEDIEATELAALKGNLTSPPRDLNTIMQHMKNACMSLAWPDQGQESRDHQDIYQTFIQRMDAMIDTLSQATIPHSPELVTPPTFSTLGTND